MNIILYGPLGVGKSTVGKTLAARLGREFVDSDPLTEARAGLSIPQIFSQRGEAAFRSLETEICTELGARNNLVIAPGGGALLNPTNRAALEHNGLIVCLRADEEALLARMPNTNRPLLAGDAVTKLHVLLESRRALYDSFPVQLDTTNKTISQVAGDIEALLAPRSLKITAPGFEHEVALGYGLLENLTTLLAQRSLTGTAVIVTDENIAAALPFFKGQARPVVVLPPGEDQKSLATIARLYEAFLAHGLDRNSIVIAVGGGVIGDMVGFAAATYMRGIKWVNVPTTLLSMVDASLGGKTGVDLPQGKNLVGAFYPPSLIVSDPLTLQTLPRREWAGGMAEVIKHGLIDDASLFEWIEAGHTFGSVDVLQQAISVKVRVVNEDPYERGRRALLNVGHTIGHAVESASGFKLSHGECVAIGMVAEAKLAKRLGLAEAGLPERVARVCEQVGLPVNARGMAPGRIRQLMNSDKKKAGKQLKFALPKKVGEAVWGIEADEAVLMDTLNELVA